MFWSRRRVPDRRSPLVLTDGGYAGLTELERDSYIALSKAIDIIQLETGNHYDDVISRTLRPPLEKAEAIRHRARLAEWQRLKR